MAGAILVSLAPNGAGVSMGGPAFRYFVELIREQLIANGDERYIKDIYFGHDESYSGFISVGEQDVEGFNSFCRAAVAASKISLAAPPTYEELWEELIKKLRADPRWRAQPALI